MNDLDAQIAERERELADLERLERAREELPLLRAERERQAKQERARDTMAQVQALSRQALADRLDSVPGWRERFAAWVQDGESLARELETIERPTQALAERVASAVRGCQNVGVPTAHVEGVWVDWGWTDARLAVWDNRDDGRSFRTMALDEHLMQLLARAAGVHLLNPSGSIRQFIGSGM